MANQDFQPTDQQQQVIEVFREEYRANPRRVRDVTGLEKQRINEALNALMHAGWIDKISRGLYELTYDGEGYVEIELKYVHD